MEMRNHFFGENFVIGVITLNVVRTKFSPLGVAWLEWEMSSLLFEVSEFPTTLCNVL